MVVGTGAMLALENKTVEQAATVTDSPMKFVVVNDFSTKIKIYYS